MTVKELRALLAEADDDAVINVYSDSGWIRMLITNVEVTPGVVSIDVQKRQ